MNSIGALEFRSIGKGIEVSNELAKKFSVEILYSKTMCIGKFFFMISGETANIKDAIEYGIALGESYVIDNFIINAISPEIIDGFKFKYKRPKRIQSIAVVETKKVCSGIKILDKALKSGNTSLIKLQISAAIGGKLMFILAGDIGSLDHGLKEAKDSIKEKDLVYMSTIALIDQNLLNNLL